MTAQSKLEYLRAIRTRYLRVGKKFKSHILDEFCRICGYHRKYAIRRLRLGLPAPAPRRGSQPIYGNAGLLALKRVWFAAEQLCSTRLKAALPLWLPFYETTYGVLAPDVRQRLLAMSPATIDRLLKPTRLQEARRRRSGTRPGRWLKNQIPLRTDNDDITAPGFVEADTVAHCGEALSGNFVWSLTFTDSYSGWTELRAVWNKGATDVLAALREMETGLPFALRGFDCDNGSEFLNFHLWRFWIERPVPLKVTRTRPYHKNDNAHVEQKNWTHVRQLLGYGRFDNPAVVPLLNQLYRDSWGALHNFYCPSVKLQSKRREGSRWVKRHDAPRTPYQRLLASGQLEPLAAQRLRQRYERLDPFELKQEIERKLRQIFAKLR